MELYEIIYDYTDESGFEAKNCVEEFEGTWLELKAYIKKPRQNGCYNITAAALRQD